jgi:quercetin dioxygenase-like cupin family protein
VQEEQMREQSQIVSSARYGPDSGQGSAFIDFDREIARLRADTSVKEVSGRRTRMLAKYAEFRIVLITMNAGSKWDDHKTNSRISVQVLRGEIRFHTMNNAFELCPGQLLALDPGVLHSVDSPQESAFLLTLSDAVPGAEPATP